MEKLEWMLNLIMETMGIDATPFQEMKTDLFKKNVDMSQLARAEHRDREQTIPSPDNVPLPPFGWSTVKRVSLRKSVLQPDVDGVFPATESEAKTKYQGLRDQKLSLP